MRLRTGTAMLGLALTAACAEESPPDPHAEALALVQEADGLWKEDPARALRLYDAALPALTPQEAAAVTYIKGYVHLEYIPGEASAAQGLRLIEQASRDSEAAGAWCTLIRSETRLASIEMSHGGGDFGRADAHLVSAEAHADACGSPDTVATLHHRRAEWFRQRGDLVGRARSIQSGLRIAPPDTENTLWLRFADAEVRHDLGDITDDGEAYARVAAEANQRGLWRLEANSLLALGNLQRDAEDPTAAREAFEKAVRLSERESLAGERAMAQLELVRLHTSAGDLARARDMFSSLDRSSLSPLVPRQLHVAQQVEADLLAAEGQTRAAEALYRGVLDHPRAESEARWRARLGLAGLASHSGDAVEARRQRWDVLRAWEGERAATSLELLQKDGMSQRVGIYVDWLEGLVEAWSDAGRPRLRKAPGPWNPDQAFVTGPVTADDLLAAVEGISSRGLAAELVRDRSSLDSLGVVSGEGAPALSPWRSGPEVRSGLSTPVVVYQALRNHLLVLLATREDVQVYLVPVPWQELLEVLHRLRVALAGVPSAAPDELDVLGAWLLGPLRPLLREPDAVLGFVLRGRLAEVPLPALRIDGRYLVERVAPFELPNLQASVTLPRRPRPTGRWPAVGISAAPNLPFAQREMELLRREDLDTTWLSGEDVTPDRVLSAIEGPAIVHLSLHGDAPLPAVVGAGGVVAPGQAGALLLAGGQPLAVERLRSARLVCHLAILSSCLSRVGDGRYLEYARGAAHRAMLAAGAEAALASGWKVSDEATFALMERFYAHFPGLGRAVALARAQRAMLASGARIVSTWQRQLRPAPPSLGLAPAPLAEVVGVPYAAPWAWGGFTLVGRWD